MKQLLGRVLSQTRLFFSRLRSIHDESPTASSLLHAEKSPFINKPSNSKIINMTHVFLQICLLTNFFDALEYNRDPRTVPYLTQKTSLPYDTLPDPNRGSKPPDPSPSETLSYLIQTQEQAFRTNSNLLIAGNVPLLRLTILHFWIAAKATDSNFILNLNRRIFFLKISPSFDASWKDDLIEQLKNMYKFSYSIFFYKNTCVNISHSRY